MRLTTVRRCLCAAGALCALVLGGIDGAALAQRPHLFDTIKRTDNGVHDGITTLQTADIWDPHDLTYSFRIGHLHRRLNRTVPLHETDRIIMADIERLEYIDGHVVDYETPEDFLLAITAIKGLRPDHKAAIDGGLSVSWARLLGRDGNGQYRNHDAWREDAQLWRPAIEVADYWASAHYRDGHPQEEWIERMRVFTSLFREQFPGKPLMIVIWHRERVGPDRSEEWITMRDYVEMGIAARNMGCHVTAFGRESTNEGFRQAQEYFARLQAEW